LKSTKGSEEHDIAGGATTGKQKLFPIPRPAKSEYLAGRKLGQLGRGSTCDGLLPNIGRSVLSQEVLQGLAICGPAAVVWERTTSSTRQHPATSRREPAPSAVPASRKFRPKLEVARFKDRNVALRNFLLVALGWYAPRRQIVHSANR
jgi:hypothetical protein